MFRRTLLEQDKHNKILVKFPDLFSYVSSQKSFMRIETSFPKKVSIVTRRGVLTLPSYYLKGDNDELLHNQLPKGQVYREVLIDTEPCISEKVSYAGRHGDMTRRAVCSSVCSHGRKRFHRSHISPGVKCE